MKPLTHEKMISLLGHAWEKNLPLDVKQRMFVTALSQEMSDAVLIKEFAKTEAVLSWNEISPRHKDLLARYQVDFLKSDEYKELELELLKYDLV